MPYQRPTGWWTQGPAVAGAHLPLQRLDAELTRAGLPKQGRAYQNIIEAVEDQGQEHTMSLMVSAVTMRRTLDDASRTAQLVCDRLRVLQPHWRAEPAAVTEIKPAQHPARPHQRLTLRILLYLDRPVSPAFRKHQRRVPAGKRV